MRMSRHRMFMEIARVVSNRSTCLRLNVGAILVDGNHNIRSIGYNGAASGRPHCSQHNCVVRKSDHAEVNAITRAGDIRGSLYTTHSPCLDCAKTIIKYGTIEQVFFETHYRDEAGIVELLMANINVHRITPNGIIIEQLLVPESRFHLGDGKVWEQ